MLKDNENVTHAHPFCPLWGLEVHEGVQFYPEEGLSVGVVNTDISVADQLAKLDEIKSLVSETCIACSSHISKSIGACEPGGFYSGGLVSTLVVNQRSEIPEEIKSNEMFHYFDL